MFPTADGASAVADGVLLQAGAALQADTLKLFALSFHTIPLHVRFVGWSLCSLLLIAAGANAAADGVRDPPCRTSQELLSVALLRQASILFINLVSQSTIYVTAAGATVAADGVRDLLPAGAALQADTLERRKEASVSLHNWQHVLAELGQRAAEMNAYTHVILAHHIPHLCVFADDCEVVQI